MIHRHISMAIFMILTLPALSVAEGFNEKVRQCSKLLPKGKKYELVVQFDLDRTTDQTEMKGNFSINWHPAYMPSSKEQKVAFKALTPFIDCVGPELMGNSAKK